MFTITVRYNVPRFPTLLVGSDCHAVKSLAGTLFHYAESVEQVTVKDSNGNVFLNLDKSCPDENISIPSEFAGMVFTNITP